jgi:hypothetical protein
MSAAKSTLGGVGEMKGEATMPVYMTICRSCGEEYGPGRSVPAAVERPGWCLSCEEAECTCDASERDSFGNVDRIPNPSCPVHES